MKNNIFDYTKETKNNSSGKVGVYWRSERQMFETKIDVNGVQYYLYSSPYITDCIKIRKAAETAVRKGTFDSFYRKFKLMYGRR